MNRLTLSRKLKTIAILSIGGTAACAGISLYKQNAKFYKEYVMPLVQKLDPEMSHRLAVFASKYGLFPSSNYEDPHILRVNIFGKEFPNPIGMAAGFDKHGEAVTGLLDLGFGFVEIGSVTPQPQPGNPKPRVFRLKEDKAVINRYGFNSEGHDTVFKRLESLKHNEINGVVGVNLGKNKTSEDPISDYVEGVKKFAPVADYLVINVSSPNTPGLRSLQSKDVLQNLLAELITVRNALPPEHRPPLLLKLSPDLTSAERQDIASVLNKEECRVDGLIICNTTTDRPNLISESSKETGGLSGRPLGDVSTKMISEMYKLTKGIKIIGVGGIFSGKDAYDKIKAGASLVQVYTAFIYQGPPCATEIKKELVRLLKADGYANVSQAVGVDVK